MGSVSSNVTGVPVFCWIIAVCSRIESPTLMSETRSRTRSQAPQLAVDRKIEHGEVAKAALMLHPGSNGPNVLRLERRLWSDEPTAVPGDAS